MRTVALVLAAFVLSLTTSCAGTQYGSREYPVEFATVPPDCQCWILPNTEWVFQKERILQEGGAALKKYESFRSKRPETKSLLPYVHVFVAMNANQQLLWKEFTPSRDPSVLIEFDVDEVSRGGEVH
jgi:hypothetical protein